MNDWIEFNYTHFTNKVQLFIHTLAQNTTIHTKISISHSILTVAYDSLREIYPFLHCTFFPTYILTLCVLKSFNSGIRGSLRCVVWTLLQEHLHHWWPLWCGCLHWLFFLCCNRRLHPSFHFIYSPCHGGQPCSRTSEEHAAPFYYLDHTLHPLYWPRAIRKCHHFHCSSFYKNLRQTSLYLYDTQLLVPFPFRGAQSFQVYVNFFFF